MATSKAALVKLHPVTIWGGRGGEGEAIFAVIYLAILSSQISEDTFKRTELTD